MESKVVKGIYRNNRIELAEKVSYKEPVQVLVTFLNPVVEKTRNKKFSFHKSLQLTKNSKDSLSELVVRERRNSKW